MKRNPVNSLKRALKKRKPQGIVRGEVTESSIPVPPFTSVEREEQMSERKGDRGEKILRLLTRKLKPIGKLPEKPPLPKDFKPPVVGTDIDLYPD